MKTQQKRIGIKFLAIAFLGLAIGLTTPAPAHADCWWNCENVCYWSWQYNHGQCLQVPEEDRGACFDDAYGQYESCVAVCWSQNNCN